MAERYFAGLDLGTTGAKTIIFDLKGNPVASGYREYGCYFPHPTWVEQDVNEMIAALYETIKEAFAKSGIDPKDVVSLAASSTRGNCVFMDKDDRPLKLISWQDSRTVEEVALIDEKLGSDRFYQITGMPNSTVWSLQKILYVREKEPELWEKTKKHVQLQDALLKALGAEGYYQDQSEISLMGLWDTDNFEFSKEIHDVFGLDWDMYPEVVQPGTVVGKIGKEVSEKSGFAVGTPICVGIGDQSAAAVGAGVVWPGMLSVSLGTGGMAVAFLDKKYRDPLGKTCICNHAVDGKWQFEGLQNGSAGVFKWFRDEIAVFERELCKKDGKDVYDVLTALAGTVPTGANGLLLIPHFATAAMPRWNSYARGLLFGLTLSHGKAHMARAFMEGIILEMKDIIQAMLTNGIELTGIRIIGGPTRSELWNQIQADIYELPAETLKVTDAAVLGAGLAGLVGIGEFKDIREAVGALVQPGKRYEPIPENVKVYREMFDIYTKVYEALDASGAYPRISAMQE